MAILDGLQSFVQWVFINSIKASILIALISLIQWFVRDRLPAKWQHALWLILIVRLLLPAGLESHLSLYNLLNKSDRPREISTRILTQPIRIAAETPSSDPTLIEQTTRQFSIVDLCALLWMTGALAFTFITLIGNLKCRIKIRERQPVSEIPFLNSFAGCRKRMNVGWPVQLAQLDTIQIPMLYGWLRPVILLPSSQIRKWTPNQVNHILCHELAHLKRHDILIAHITTLLQILHWFNPFMWLAFYKIRLDREIACDVIALNHLGREQSKSYGSTILSLLENISTKNLLPTTVGIVESRKNLKRRLTSIAKFKKPRMVWTIIGLTLALLVGCAALTEATKKDSKQVYIAETTGPMSCYSDDTGTFEADGQLIGRIEITNWKLKSDTSKALRIFGKNVRLKQLDDHRWMFEGERLVVDTLPAQPKVWPKERMEYIAETVGPMKYYADTTSFQEINGRPYYDISGKFEISNWKLKSDSMKTLQITGENAFISENENGGWLILADELHVDTTQRQVILLEDINNSKKGIDNLLRQINNSSDKILVGHFKTDLNRSVAFFGNKVKQRNNIFNADTLAMTGFSLPNDSTKVLRVSGKKVFMKKTDNHYWLIEADVLHVDTVSTNLSNQSLQPENGFTVVLDPAHGDKDPGIIVPEGFREKDLTLKICQQLAKTVQANGFQVHMTRTDDSFVSLPERNDIINSSDADLALSIHCDYNHSSERNGITFYHGKDDSVSLILCQTVKEYLLQNKWMAVNDIHQAGFSILKNEDIPTALIELGYMSNPEDLELLSNPEFIADCCQRISSAVLSFSENKPHR